MITTRGNPERRKEFLKICFDVLCENGLENTSLKMLSEACGVTNGNLIYYFGTKENLVAEATAYCMEKVEDDFMKKAPTDFEEIEQFLEEMPYLTARLHGKKYRLMYQVYTSPKYIGQGKAFFKGVNIRYKKYAEYLAENFRISSDYLLGMINTFVRACVHYALFEDGEYLNSQLQAIRISLHAVRKLSVERSVNV